ncbi:Trichome birefringence-like, N-terminal domain [Dillenia turbinata]|uniref:Trichome birefringence-like, N-terminal domain n=1 Tax=Dillenia turbinata TaxID=194707 RepID=A0AAN8ZMT1_9MAGN
MNRVQNRRADRETINHRKERRKICMSRKFFTEPSTWGIKCNFYLTIIILLPTLIFIALYMNPHSWRPMDDVTKCKTSEGPPPPPLQPPPPPPQCNLFSGKWVFDNKSQTLYNGTKCIYMSDEFACEKFGRKDLKYLKWRWQPHHCDLPRFNATALLERLRNKRLLFVGDSLNRNQWVSLVCMVESSIPHWSLKSFSQNVSYGSFLTFKAIAYNASIEYYWAPMLVESNSDDPVNHRLPDRFVRVKAIEKHARFWNDADILVFNSYLWWRWPEMKVLWGSFDSPDGIYKIIKNPHPYEMALQTWSDWLEFHINPNKTTIFFMSMSPTHQWAEEWGKSEGQNCYNETEPIFKEGFWGRGSYISLMRAIEAAIDNLKCRGVNVRFLNITQLSEYRKDAHPTVYKKIWNPTEEQLARPIRYADCTHWCLPGVPDVWNQLLYAYILDKSYDQRNIG